MTKEEFKKHVADFGGISALNDTITQYTGEKAYADSSLYRFASGASPVPALLAVLLSGGTLGLMLKNKKQDEK